jgi:hypothetical protein
MTRDELQVLIDLLGVDERLRPALSRILVDRADAAPTQLDGDLARVVAAVRAAEARVRATFVCHRYSEWEVVVGHHDYHRAPGKVRLAVGERVRLICSRTDLLVPVEVTHLPATPRDYHRGIIVAGDLPGARYRAGDGVMFGVEQAVLSSERRRYVRRQPVGVV